MSRRTSNRGMLEVTDRLQTAFERELQHRRRPLWPPEFETTLMHMFKCVCCERQRREEDRREPDSEVCIYCVLAAGQAV